VTIPSIEEYGYRKGSYDGQLELVYDFEVQIKKIVEQVDLAVCDIGRDSLLVC
jgi:hypothetical protein